MANEIQLAHSATNVHLYALVRSATGTVWKTTTSAFITYLTAQLGNCAISLTEQGTASQFYVGDFPAAAAGTYSVSIYVRAGGSPAEGDTLAGVQHLEWDGSAVIPLYSRLAPLVAANAINVDSAGNVVLGSGSLKFLSGNGTTKVTQNAGTRIQIAMGGEFDRLFTHAVNLNYTPGATTHTGTLMKGASRTKVNGTQAAASTTVVSTVKLTDGGGNDIAASDVLCIHLDNGTWHLTTVSALDSAKTTITLTDAIPAGRSVADGARITCYGVAGDSFHTHQQYSLPTGSTTNLPSTGGPLSLCKASYLGEPVVFDSNNASNAGTVNYCNWSYTQD